MVRIRLRRVGARGQPSYRIVVADKESPRDGRFLEILGFYNPRTQPATIQLREERIYEWMSKGAKPTESVGKVFQMAGLTERYAQFKKGAVTETPPKQPAEPKQPAKKKVTRSTKPKVEKSTVATKTTKSKSKE